SYGSFETSDVFAGVGLVEPTPIQVTAYQTHTSGSYRLRNDDETLRSTLLASGHLDIAENFPLYWKTFNLVARQIGSTPGSTVIYNPQSYFNDGHLHSLILLAKHSSGFSVKSSTTAAFLDQ